jgi:hypothetical protein
MRSHFRRFLLRASLAGALALTIAATLATPAFSYGKATWQTALTGTFVFPGTGTGIGFWGWCDFAGGVTSGPDADCQIAEYFHLASGAGWTCELSIDGSWTQGPEVFDPESITFHMTGRLDVHGHLTPQEQNSCVGFFTTGDPTFSNSSRTFTDVDTFIPASPGHYAIPPSVIFGPGVVGEFNFTVAELPQ